MSDSYIVSDGTRATSFVGPDAVELFRAATLKASLRLLEKGIAPTRGLTITRALQLATDYTGKKYKRSEIQKARDDLELWIVTMRAALPVVEG